jgi:hypothetical protein
VPPVKDVVAHYRTWWRHSYTLSEGADLELQGTKNDVVLPYGFGAMQGMYLARSWSGAMNGGSAKWEWRSL